MLNMRLLERFSNCIKELRTKGGTEEQINNKSVYNTKCQKWCAKVIKSNLQSQVYTSNLLCRAVKILACLKFYEVHTFFLSSAADRI